MGQLTIRHPGYDPMTMELPDQDLVDALSHLLEGFAQQGGALLGGPLTDGNEGWRWIPATSCIEVAFDSPRGHTRKPRTGGFEPTPVWSDSSLN